MHDAGLGWAFFTGDVPAANDAFALHVVTSRVDLVYP